MASGRLRTVFPGFGITLGLGMAYLGLLVLIPFAALFARASGLGLSGFVAALDDPRVLAACRFSFGVSLAAAALKAPAGLVVAWVLARYTFPLRGFADALVDLPFALPTAVAGITLAALFTDQGWIGRWTASLGLHLLFTPVGVLLALMFVGLPFTVRTVQPVLETLEADQEEASACLGADRWQTLRWVVFPTLLPACLTGFALAFARGLGEYGSVVFVSGGLPLRTETAPVLIMARLQRFDVQGATAIALVMMAASFSVFLAVHGIRAWAARGRESV